MGGGGAPSGGIYRIDDKRSLPVRGVPNTRAHLYKNRRKIQSRWYGLDGRVQRNRDYFHQDAHDNHEFPHDHEWNWSNNSPRGKDIEPDWSWN